MVRVTEGCLRFSQRRRGSRGISGSSRNSGSPTFQFGFRGAGAIVDDVTRLATMEAELIVEVALPPFGPELAVRSECFRNAAGLTVVLRGGGRGGGSGRLPLVLLLRRLRLV